MSLETLPLHKKRTWKFYLLVFVVPVVVLELVYISRTVFPFGGNSLLALDLNAQYICYYGGWRDAILKDGGLLYSWSRTLGGEMFGQMAYYTASPFMFVYLLFPKAMITEALLVTALLRTGCAALSFAYYLVKSRGGSAEGPGAVKVLIFSTLYALMGYMVIHQMNPMWLDAVILLPMVMYGVELLLKEGKFVLYVGALAVTFVSNFYIGYMVAIFTLCYFFYVYFTECEYGAGSGRRFARKFAAFAGLSLLAAAISAFMLVPTYYSLMLGKSEFTDPSYALKAKFALFDLLPKLLFGAYDTCRPEGLPTLYIGTMPLLLLPVFFTNRQITVRKKVMSAVIVFILLMSMTMSTADLVWHGFQNPNWLNYRYSFILCGFLLVMAFEAFNKTEGYSPASIARAAAGMLLLLVLLEKFGGYDYFDVRITIWSSLFLVMVYFGFLAFDAKERGRHVTGLVLLLAFVCLESYANSLANLQRVHEDVAFTSRERYRRDFDKVYPAVSWLNEHDSGFYRADNINFRVVNDPILYGYKGINHSSSTFNKDAVAYAQKWWFDTGGHSVHYRAINPPRDGMLGVKYIMFEDKYENTFGLDVIYEENGMIIAENPCALPIIYPVSRDYFDYLAAEDPDASKPGYVANPFEVVNETLSAMLGSSEVIPFYTPIPMPEMTLHNVDTTSHAYGYTKYYHENTGNSNAHIEFRLKGIEGKEIYAAFPSAYPRKSNIWLQIGEKPKELGETQKQELLDLYQNNSGTGGIFCAGLYDEGEEFTFRIGIELKDGKSEGIFIKDMLFYTFDHELFNELFAPVRGSVEKLELESTTRISLSLNVEEGQAIFASIPYERGWAAKVDGEKTEVFRTEDGLLGFAVPAGKHEVTLAFTPDYYYKSCALSLFGLLVFAALLAGKLWLEKKSIKFDSISEAVRFAVSDGGAEEEGEE